MQIGKEKLQTKKGKVYIVFWTAYWIVTAYYLLRYANLILGIGTDEEQRPWKVILFVGLLAFYIFTVIFCYYRWGNYYTTKNPKGSEFAARIKWYEWSYLIIADIYSFLVMELVNNSECILQMEPKYVLANLAGGFIMGLICFLIFNSLRRACMTLTCFATVMSFIFYFVYASRGEPFQLIDIFSFGTAMQVAGGYEFVFTRWTAVFVVLMLCLIGIMDHVPDRVLVKKLHSKIIIRGMAAGCIIGGYFFLFYANWNSALGIVTDLWAPHKTYAKVGTNVGFFCVTKFMKNDPPSGYNVEKLKIEANEIEEEYEAWSDKPKSSEITPVNIIVIMNESWSDYRHAGKLETTEEFMSYFDSMTENVIKGSTAVCISGGGTSKSEYEVLTGNSVKQYPGVVPYVNFYTHSQYSLVSSLKAQGYDAIAIHPNKGTNWNRTTAYGYLGFDKFYTIDDFDEDTLKYRGMISDMADYELIADLVDNKESSDDPLFIFNVTMQNHGGYSTDNYPIDVEVVGFEDESVNRYLSLEKNTDEALEYLIEHFKEVDEPTMIVMFGDHYPDLSDEFKSFVAGQEYSTLSVEDEELFYETPFFIWTNYDSKTQLNVTTSGNFLHTIIMEKTGLELTPMEEYEQMLMTKIKAYNHLGYYTTDGTFHAWSTASDEILELINQYECFQYNTLMETSNRLDWFFTVPVSGN